VVVQALDSFGLILALSQRRKQHRSKNRYCRYDDSKLDQRNTLPAEHPRRGRVVRSQLIPNPEFLVRMLTFIAEF